MEVEGRVSLDLHPAPPSSAAAAIELRKKIGCGHGKFEFFLTLNAVQCSAVWTNVDMAQLSAE